MHLPCQLAVSDRSVLNRVLQWAQQGHPDSWEALALNGFI